MVVSKRLEPVKHWHGVLYQKNRYLDTLCCSISTRWPIMSRKWILIFLDDRNTLYNYGALPIFQHNRYAVTFVWMRDGTTSLVTMISFREWFGTLTLQPSIHVDGIGIPRNVSSRFEQHVSGGRTRESKFHILPLIEHFEQSRGTCRVRWLQAHKQQYRQHRHGSDWKQEEAPWINRWTGRD